MFQNKLNYLVRIFSGDYIISAGSPGNPHPCTNLVLFVLFLNLARKQEDYQGLNPMKNITVREIRVVRTNKNKIGTRFCKESKRSQLGLRPSTADVRDGIC